MSLNEQAPEDVGEEARGVVRRAAERNEDVQARLPRRLREADEPDRVEDRLELAREGHADLERREPDTVEVDREPASQRSSAGTRPARTWIGIAARFAT